MVERSCVLPVCIYLNPQWRFPVWESCVDKLVKILLCEGGDVEQCARTSKHIRVFAFDPFTLTLSLLYCALHHFILLIHILYAWLVCVCLTCV